MLQAEETFRYIVFKITHPDISVIQFGGNMKKVLTIAGSDSSGGAGIQADIKTITVHGMFAMSVITAVTAQNTLGVAAIEDISPDCVKSQLDCVFTDIFPDAVKIGMVSNPEIIGVIAERLSFYRARNIVLDPVMVSTSGFSLISQDAKSALVSKLIPMATVITPNIPEAEVLCGFGISDESDMLKAARSISSGCGKNVSVLIKGGHFAMSRNAHSSSDGGSEGSSEGSSDSAVDFLVVAGSGKEVRYAAPRIDNRNTHGTGCTLSSAIACGLASGCPLEVAVQRAKDYLTGAIAAGLDLGAGSGPLNHMYVLHGDS